MFKQMAVCYFGTHPEQQTKSKPDGESPGRDAWTFPIAAALLVFPFVNILHFASPIPNLWGKSAWLVIPFVILTLAYLSKSPPLQWQALRRHYQFLALVLVFVVVVVARAFAYGESVLALHLRFVVTGLVYLGLAEALVREEGLKYLFRLMVIQGVAVAVFLYANFNFFPSLMLIQGTHGLEGLTNAGERTRFMLLSPSVAGNQILCSMFVLYACFRKSAVRNSSDYLIFWLLFELMLYSISLGGSRYPLAIALALSALACFELKDRRSWKGMVLAMLLLALMNLAVSELVREANLASPNLRYEEGDGGRLEKLYLALKVMSESPRNLLIGASLQEISAAASPSGVKISDNSYAMVMLVMGIPVGSLFFLAWGWRLRKYGNLMLGRFYLGYLAVGLSLTNCLLWETWLCSALFALPVIAALGAQASPSPTIPAASMRPLQAMQEPEAPANRQATIDTRSIH